MKKFYSFLTFLLIAAFASAGTYNKVTDAASLKVGDKIIIVHEGSKSALSTTQNKDNRGATSVTISDNVIATISNAVQVLTLEAGTSAGQFAFNTGSGYLYAASSSKNYLKTQTTNDANGSWSISISNGNATIKANGTNTRNLLKKNSSSALFSCYGSGQNNPQIYKYTENAAGFVAAPVITPSEGDFHEAQTVTITADEGATIDYTVTKNGEEYSSVTDAANPVTFDVPFEEVENTWTITATAKKDGNTSEETTVSFKISPITGGTLVFEKITDISQITQNDKVILVAKYNNKYYALGNQGSSRRPAYELTPDNNDSFTIINYVEDKDLEDAGIFKLTTEVDGENTYYTFNDFDYHTAENFVGYLAWTSSTNFVTKTATTTATNYNTHWNISIDTTDGTALITSQGDSSRAILMQNSGLVYRTYSTSNTNGYTTPSLYHVNLKLSGVESNVVKVDADVKAIAGGIVINATEATNVNVYNFAGQAVKSATISNGTTTIALPRGMYIVRAGAKATKVVVR